MDGVLEKNLIDSAPPALSGLGLESARARAADSRISSRKACYHCGEPCPDSRLSMGEKVFCCRGCLFVHDLLTQSGLEQFYRLSTHPGVRIRGQAGRKDWGYLDDAALQSRLLDFTDGKTSRITFHIPSIHCVACVWLLENLFRLLSGIGKSEVNFPRREVSITFAAERVQLSELVELLVSIGYEPELNYARLDKQPVVSTRKKVWLQIGLAGFAFGNIMLFSLPAYLGLDHFSGPAFKALFGYLGLVLAAPVLIYSASDYWRSAWLAARQRMLTLEVPIALGLLALYARSFFEVVSGRGEGYADSLAGLVFLLLCGRAFQQKTHERLAFDRDYKSFFPLSVKRRKGSTEENVALSNLEVGDRVVLRNGELIPADSRLVTGSGLIDYSFVTGESQPVEKEPGEHLYAGGQQVGGAIEIETVKAVSQSYLTSLWNHEAFGKTRTGDLNTLTNRYSRRFTKIVIGVAMASALFWVLRGDAGRGFKAFTSVLIVACPCALALAAPFALGTAQRLLGKVQVYLKNILVLERMAEADAIVFDKTGTLTSLQGLDVTFHPAQEAPSECENRAGERSLDSQAMLRTGTFRAAALQSISALSLAERAWVASLASHSAHPHAKQIAVVLSDSAESAIEVRDFVETPGAGIEGVVESHRIQLGSRAWLQRHDIRVRDLSQMCSGSSWLAIDGTFRGVFVLANALRPRTAQTFARLSRRYELALLSGDNERERARFSKLFGENARLHFNQSPIEKLSFIKKLQETGKRVIMVGDGLNDAGALRQSDVGVAVVEQAGVFSPASDVILEAGQVAQLEQILRFARAATRIVRASFGISALYNAVGISIAAAGILSPFICAVLMPVSSLSVLLFGCGMTNLAARRCGLTFSLPD